MHTSVAIFPVYAVGREEGLQSTMNIFFNIVIIP